MTRQEPRRDGLTRRAVLAIPPVAAVAVVLGGLPARAADRDPVVLNADGEVIECLADLDLVVR